MKRRDQCRQGGRGQTTVEFALVVVVFLLLALGLVDLGRAVMLYNTVATAAEEGARFGVVQRDATWGSDRFATSVDGNTPKTYGAPGGIASYLASSYENTIVGQVARRCSALDPNRTTVVIGVYSNESAATAPTPTTTTDPGHNSELWVTVSYPFDPVAGQFLHIGSITVSATAKMFIE